VGTGAAFVLGALLFGLVIRKVGVQTIFTALGRVGFGFFFVWPSRTAARAAHDCHESVRFAGTPSFYVLSGVLRPDWRRSMSFLTFAGPLLGEATKVAMLRKRVPLVTVSRRSSSTISSITFQ